MACVLARYRVGPGALAPAESLARWLPFEPTKLETHRSHGAEIAVWSWDAPLDNSIKQVDGRGLFIDGLAGDPAAVVLQALRAPAMPALDELAGGFAAVVTDEDRLIAYSSGGANYPLYWADLGDHVVVSNRAAAVAGISGAVVDTEASVWMASAGFGNDGYATFRGVRQLLPGERLVIRAQGSRAAITVEQPDLAEVFARASASPRELAERVDGCADRVIRSLELLPTTAQWHMTLSGGKDSRAVIAMLDAADLLEQITQVRTGGPGYSPDVLAARGVVAALGLERRHVVDSPGLEFGAMRIASSVVQSLGSSGASISLFDPVADTFTPGDVIFAGHQRSLKPSRLSKLPYDDLDTFAAAAAVDWLDPARILTEEARERVRELRHQSMVDLHGRGVPVDRLADASNWQHRGGGWTGNLVAAHRAAHHHVNPLMDSLMTGLTFSLPRGCGDGELIPFLVTRRARHDLVGAPFARTRWRPALGQALELVGRADLMPPLVDGFRVPPAMASMFSPHMTSLADATLRGLAPLMRELATSTPLAVPYLDVAALDARLSEVTAGESVAAVEAIALLGVAAVLLASEYGPRLFDRQERERVIVDVEEHVAAAPRPKSPEERIAIYQSELLMRDDVLAAFCVEDQSRRQRAAQRAVEAARRKAEPVTSRLRRKIRRRLSARRP